MDSKDWLDVLRCPTCRGALERTPGGCMRCRRCSLAIGQNEGVYDFLAQVHPVVKRELDAIRAKDSGDPEFMTRFRRWLESLDSGSDDFSDDDKQSPFVRNALFHRKRVRELLERYPIEKGTLLVELGADHCWTSGIFIDAGSRVIAVDVSDHLALAPRRNSAMLLRLNADMNSLPIKDRSADYVFANAAAHHSWNLQQTFAEAHRVLRPRGRFYLCSEPMPGMLRYLVFRMLDNFGRDERAAGINETLQTRNRWVRLARKAGFTPALVFPRLSDADINAKLREHGLPGFVRRIVVPLLEPLQVSIHMVAEKRPDPAG